MARKIVVSMNGVESPFGFSKLERSRLYPTRKRVPLDASGAPCTRASMVSDGSNVLRSGMTAQGYFAESGRWVAREELVGLNPDGSLAELKPSTLGVAQTLDGPLAPRELLDLEVVGVYLLDAAEADPALIQSLGQGHVYRFPFNYGADYNCETAFILSNDEGVFVVVGNPVTPGWVEEAAVFVAEPEEETSDDLDFEMM